MPTPREILEKLKFKAHPYNPEDEDKRAHNKRVDLAKSELALWVRSRKDCRDGSMSTREAYNLALEDISKSMEEV